jgi:dipeptidyl aminopeptidase/acylaminoacyl peptidase
MEHLVLDLETLLRIPYVEPYSRFDISPDGKRVAFSWNPTGQWEIYLMPLDGVASPRQITAGPGGKFGPRWSPDGQRLTYVLDMDGGERYDIYVYDLAAGQHTNLTPDTPNAIMPDYSWSPDGSHLAFISNRSGCFDTYVMPSTGGLARLMLSLPYHDWKVHWSPDGRWLAVVTVARGQDYWTFIVPAEGGTTPFDGPSAEFRTGLRTPRPISPTSDPINAKDTSWSPDSSRIAFASNLHGYFDIGVYEMETRQITWVTEGEGSKEQPHWSPDGQRLAYVVSHGPVTELTVLELETGDSATYQVEPGVCYQPRFTPYGDHLVFVFDNPRHPCDLWTLSLPKGTPRRLTCSLPSELQDVPFVMPTEVRYPSLDGRSVPALLYQPRQAEELPPAVVYVHGGPNWLFQVTWDPLLQHMVSRGWVVLAPNYRGSTGYGREWQLANRFDLGGGDTQDVVAGADYLVREGLADSARIAVTGKSYGGYLTMTSLTQYPDRWAAGSAVVPFLNWFTSHVNSREDLQHWDRENFGNPEENHDLWHERSPFFFLDRIAAPVQLICGAHDVRCPASESTQAHDTLKALGKPCELILYPDEGHSFLKTENVVDAKKHRVDFLAKALEAEGQEAIPSPTR